MAHNHTHIFGLVLKYDYELTLQYRWIGQQLFVKTDTTKLGLKRTTQDKNQVSKIKVYAVGERSGSTESPLPCLSPLV